MKLFVFLLFISISFSSFLQDLKEKRQLDSNYIYLLDSLVEKDQFVRNRKHSKANRYYLKSSNDSYVEPIYEELFIHEIFGGKKESNFPGIYSLIKEFMQLKDYNIEY